MKIAVVHPLSAWSTRDVATGMAKGLEQEGHEVIQADLWAAACRVSNATEPRFYAQALAPEARLAALKEVVALLRETRPDWILAVHGVDLPSDLPDDLRLRWTRSALLLTDEPYELERSKGYTRGYDLVVTNDPSTLEAHRASHDRVEYLPPGFDPEVMKPDPSGVPAYDVAFVGTWFKERIALFETLWPELERRPHLLAGYWFKPGDRLPKADQPGDSFLSSKVKPMIVWPPELCRVYQRTRICLNPHRGGTWHANPAGLQALGVNPRLFEIAGAGAFQLADEREGMRRFFDPDEVAGFRDAEDCLAQLKTWLGREPERKAMAAKALKRALAEHTYRHRARTLLAWMG